MEPPRKRKSEVTPEQYEELRKKGAERLTFNHKLAVLKSTFGQAISNILLFWAIHDPTREKTISEIADKPVLLFKCLIDMPVFVSDVILKEMDSLNIKIQPSSSVGTQRNFYITYQNKAHVLPYIMPAKGIMRILIDKVQFHITKTSIFHGDQILLQVELYEEPNTIGISYGTLNKSSEEDVYLNGSILDTGLKGMDIPKIATIMLISRAKNVTSKMPVNLSLAT